MSNDERPETLAAQAAAWVPPWERQQRPPDRGYQAAAEAAARGEAGELGEAESGESVEGAGSESGRDFAEAEELAAADDLVDDDDAVVDEISADESDSRVPVAVERPDDDEERSVAGLSDDDDDFDPAFEGANPAEYYVGPGSGDISEKSVVPSEDDPEAAASPGAGEPDEGASGPGAVEEAALAGSQDEQAGVDSPLGARGEGVEAEPTAGEVGPELPLPEAVEEAAEDAWDEDGLPADAPLSADGDDAGDVFDQAADDDVSDDGVDDLPFADDLAGDEQAGGEDESDADDELEYAALDEDEVGAEDAAIAEAVADADAEDALDDERGAAAVGGDLDGEAQLTTQPAAVDAARRGRAKAGLAVPEQGRRKRDGADAVVDPQTRTSEDLPELNDDAELAAALEAILLVVDEPVAEMQLAQILEQPTERVGAMLENISARYTGAGHGFDLRRAAGGWRLYTRPEYAAYVERFVLDGQSVRLTQAALETLAVVAYKQPVTRSRISAIRGVNCDGVMRTLVTRGLIEECGTEGETGAYLYRTTALFLEKLGLNSVEQLPPLAPFLPDDVEEVLDASG